MNDKLNKFEQEIEDNYIHFKSIHNLEEVVAELKEAAMNHKQQQMEDIMSKKPTAHQHLMLYITLKSDGVKANINCPRYWEKMIDNVITEDLKMQIAIPTRAILIEDHENYGVTGAANLTTSHIAFHIWSKDQQPFIQLDIYSCKSFNPLAICNKLRSRLKDCAKIDKMYMELIDRTDLNSYYMSLNGDH